MTEQDRSLPVNWEQELAKDAKAAAEAERPKLAAISLRGGIMAYEKVNIPGNKLNAIIIASVMEHRWYKDEFNPNKPSSPACFAFHDGTDGVPWMPHPDSAIPQADSCAMCPKNEWGSDRKGGRGKDCKEVRKLALLMGTEGKEMALLSIPVMSVKNWSNYVNQVAASAKRPPWGVITEISVRPDPRSQFVVNFDLVDLIPEDKLGGVFGKLGLARDILNTPYDYTDPGETNADNKATKKAKY